MCTNIARWRQEKSLQQRSCYFLQTLNANNSYWIGFYGSVIELEWRLEGTFQHSVHRLTVNARKSSVLCENWETNFFPVRSLKSFVDFSKNKEPVKNYFLFASVAAIDLLHIAFARTLLGFSQIHIWQNRIWIKIKKWIAIHFCCNRVAEKSSPSAILFLTCAILCKITDLSIHCICRNCDNWRSF